MRFDNRKIKIKKRKLRAFLFLICSGIFVSIFCYQYFSKTFTTSTKLKEQSSEIADTQKKQSAEINKTPLGKVISQAMDQTTGTYAIFIKNLKTNETFESNADLVMEAGSLYKLWVMAVVYEKIQQGNLKKEDELSEDVKNINEKFNIDPELAEQTEGKVTYTVTNALKQMITISHNYAALLLTSQIKLSSLDIFLKENNFTSSSVGVNGDLPKTTARDIASFYEKLYQGELADQVLTREMLELLKKQTRDNGLPKYLPKNITIANKTGDIDYFKHDSGIVYTDKGDYIIVVMSESKLPAAAQERIALLSKAVFDYFNK